MNDGGINRRNAESVFMALRDIDIRVRDQQLLIERMQLSINELTGRVVELEREIMTRRIERMGRGPTVKNGDQH